MGERDGIVRVMMFAVALALVLAACSSTTTTGEGTPTATGRETGKAIGVTLKEWTITPRSSSMFEAAAGKATFEVHNEGTTAHEMVIAKTDLAPDKLPTKDGKVDEAGVTTIGEVEEFAAGKIETQSFEFTAGDYVLFCNLPAHYSQGMHAAFKVT